MSNYRRAPVTAQEQVVKAFVAAAKVIEPPAKFNLTEDEKLVFQEVIDEFAKVDWTPHSIRLAALLARAITMMTDAQQDLLNEGLSTRNTRGTPVLNPLMSATNQLAGQIMAIRRTLALHALATGSRGDLGKRRGINKENDEDSPLGGSDGLLAVPPSHVQ